MSEYWKSTPKYWCKHCSTFVKDTPLERRQHDSTAKHQGNLKRFLRSIQNDHEKNVREKDRVQAELDRVNRAVTGHGNPNPHSASTSSLSSSSNKSSAKTATAADQKRQWAQLADMGIAIPEQARADAAMPGEWHVVKKTPVQNADSAVDDNLNIGVRKRKYEGQEEEEEVIETVARKGWGSAVRKYPGSAAVVDDDLDALLQTPMTKLARVLPKQEPQTTPEREQPQARTVSPPPHLDIKSEPGDGVSEPPVPISDLDPLEGERDVVSTNKPTLSGERLALPDVLDTELPTSALFKKRKTKTAR